MERQREWNWHMDEQGNRERVHVISEWVLDQKHDTDYMDRLFTMAMNDVGSKRISDWLRDQEIHYVAVGVVAVRPMCGGRILAYAKVIVRGKGAFEHEEPYEDFPSDHFKTKILMVTGGA